MAFAAAGVKTTLSCGWDATTRPPRCPRSQNSRGGLEHLTHGVVELADAGEPSGKCDVAEPQVGGFDQYPGGLCTLRASQRKRAGADLGLQKALELARGVANQRRQPGDTNPVDLAVGDEPHRPRHDVAPRIPFGRTRDASGRQRLHARNPARWAAAEVG